MFKGGYKGKLIRIDLSEKSYKIEDIDQEIVTLLLGGRGVAAKYYYDEIAPDVKPFSKENKIIFMTGPLTGAPVYASTKMQLATKSPLTNMYCCSNSSGYFGPNLKKSGYDGIIVEGKADKPVYISIFDDRIEFHDASDIMGKKCGEVDEALKEKFDWLPNLYTNPPCGFHYVGLYACVYVYICTYACTYIRSICMFEIYVMLLRMYLRTCERIYSFMCTHLHTHIYIYIYVRTFVCMYVCNVFMYVCTCMYICMYACMLCIYVCMYVCVYV